MARSRKEDVKSKGERQQVILRLVQEHPISRQEVLLDHLSKEGFEVTQATVATPKRTEGLKRSFMNPCWG